MSAEYRGNPCQQTASAPTIRHSTLFEFKHSINSLKSLLRGIWERPFPDCEEYLDALLRTHMAPRIPIRFLEAIENTDDPLHACILPRPLMNKFHRESVITVEIMLEDDDHCS